MRFARSTTEKERIRRQQEDDEMLSRAVKSEPYLARSEVIPFGSFNR